MWNGILYLFGRSIVPVWFPVRGGEGVCLHGVYGHLAALCNGNTVIDSNLAGKEPVYKLLYL